MRVFFSATGRTRHGMAQQRGDICSTPATTRRPYSVFKLPTEIWNVFLPKRENVTKNIGIDKRPHFLRLEKTFFVRYFEVEKKRDAQLLTYSVYRTFGGNLTTFPDHHDRLGTELFFSIRSIRRGLSENFEHPTQVGLSR